MDSIETQWYQNGLRFECTACGKCCQDHGEYSYVYLVTEDIQAMSEALAIPPAQFLEQYCTRQPDGLVHLRRETSHCSFLENGRCSMYDVRPKQCKTWPFWTENLTQKSWLSEVVDFCPGAEKGKLFSTDEILTIAALDDQGFDSIPPFY